MGKIWICSLFLFVSVLQEYYQVQGERCSDVMLRLRPKITSSAEELWHKHTNKHKGTVLSVEVAINPQGEKKTPVCCSGKENTPLFTSQSCTVYFATPVNWAWCLWFFQDRLQKIQHPPQARAEMLARQEVHHSSSFKATCDAANYKYIAITLAKISSAVQTASWSHRLYCVKTGWG